jgi:hypothetical protein
VEKDVLCAVETERRWQETNSHCRRSRGRFTALVNPGQSALGREGCLAESNLPLLFASSGYYHYRAPIAIHNPQISSKISSLKCQDCVPSCISGILGSSSTLRDERHSPAIFCSLVQSAGDSFHQEPVTDQSPAYSSPP